MERGGGVGESRLYLGRKRLWVMSWTSDERAMKRVWEETRVRPKKQEAKVSDSYGNRRRDRCTSF